MVAAAIENYTSFMAELRTEASQPDGQTLSRFNKRQI